MESSPLSPPVQALRDALKRAAGLYPVCRPSEGCPICDARRTRDNEATS